MRQRDCCPRTCATGPESPIPRPTIPCLSGWSRERLLEILDDKNAPIHGLVNEKVLRRGWLVSAGDYGRPWFGQLMAGPQMIAWLIQLNAVDGAVWTELSRVSARGGRGGGSGEDPSAALPPQDDSGGAAAPSCDDRGGAAAPSCDDRGGAAAPSCDDRGGAAALSCDDRGGAAAPSCDDRGGAAAPSCDDRGGAAALSCDDRGGAAALSCDDRGGAAAPSCDDRGGAAALSCDDRGGRPCRLAMAG